MVQRDALSVAGCRGRVALAPGLRAGYGKIPVLQAVKEMSPGLNPKITCHN